MCARPALTTLPSCLFVSLVTPFPLHVVQFAVLSLCCVGCKMFLVRDDDDDEGSYAEGEGRLLMGKKKGGAKAAVMPEYQAEGFAV